MNLHILNKFGFKTISIKENTPTKQKTKSEKIDSTISIIKPQDHVNPQIVVKLSRDILSQMKWEITDRVTLMANPEKGTVALVKTNKKEKNSFAISTQGASIQVAKETKRGGIVKIGWREALGKSLPTTGTFKTTMEIFQDALIVKFPTEMFETVSQDLAA
jgi:hypothetical protein